MLINLEPADAEIVGDCHYCGNALDPRYDYSCISRSRETCDNCSQACLECDDITCARCFSNHEETRHPESRI